MKNWPIEMWTGMAACAFAMFGPPVSYWVAVGFNLQVLLCLAIAGLVVWLVSKMVQRSGTLTFYGLLIGVIMTPVGGGIAVAGLVWGIVLFGVFFVMFGFAWSEMDAKANINKNIDKTEEQ